MSLLYFSFYYFCASAFQIFYCKKTEKNGHSLKHQSSFFFSLTLPSIKNVIKKLQSEKLHIPEEIESYNLYNLFQGKSFIFKKEKCQHQLKNNNFFYNQNFHNFVIHSSLIFNTKSLCRIFS